MNNKEITNSVMNSICDSIDDGSTVLDIGFGNTTLVKKVISQKKVNKYIGIDTNADVVKKAKIKIGNNSITSFFCGSIDELTLPKVDVIIWSRIFHHFELTQARNYIDNMVSKINDGGKIIIVDSIRDYFGRENHFSYTPIFFINEISRAFNMECNRIIYSPLDNISVNQFWKLVVTKRNDEFCTEITTIQKL